MVGIYRLAQGTPCGLPEREGSADEWWRPEGGGSLHMEGCYTPGKFRGYKRVQREREAESMVERWERDRRYVQGER